MMILRIEYDDPGKDAPGDAVAASYRGIVGHLSESLPEKRWFSGDPVADWKAAIRDTVDAGYDQISLSSTCDHFVSDCRGVFGWAVEDGYGDVIVRHSPEEAMAISARIDQEDAHIDALHGSEEEGRAFMDDVAAVGELEGAMTEFISGRAEFEANRAVAELTDEDDALERFIKDTLSPNHDG